VDLNLPEDLFQQMEELPEELHAYIIEEIMNDAAVQKVTHVERSLMDHSKTQQERMSKIMHKKRTEVLLENLETIKRKNMS